MLGLLIDCLIGILHAKCSVKFCVFVFCLNISRVRNKAFHSTYPLDLTGIP